MRYFQVITNTLELYFEGHVTLLFAPICCCFEFVKQCFVSHLGANTRFVGAIFPCPNVETRLMPGGR